MTPKPIDDPQQELREQHAPNEATQNAIKNGAENLRNVIADDQKFLNQDRGAIKDAQGQAIKGANLSDSFKEMARELWGEGLKELDQAISDLDTTRNDALTEKDRELLNRLGSTLDGYARVAEKEPGKDDLPKTARDMDSAATAAREEANRAKEGIDPRATDEQILDQKEVHDKANERAQTLESANRVAQAADKLLDQMENTSITVVDRQEVGAPNQDRRPEASRIMGASANEVAKADPNQKFEWMHMLGRALGGGDPVTNLVTGNKEAHKDHTRLENLSRAIKQDMKIEAQVTCAHNVAHYNQNVKEREGSQLRFQVWASERGAAADPDAKPIVDAKLDLQSQSRDPNLKAVFSELMNLRQALKDGNSPDEAVKNLRELVGRQEALRNQDLRDEQERVQRLQHEHNLEDK